jgi:hypothetical protein
MAQGNSLIPPFIFKLFDPAEKICLVGVLFALTLKFLHLNGDDEIFMLSTSLLATVYFLMPYRPQVPVEGEEGQRRGLRDLLAATVLPKAGWIACSVELIGILYGVLHLHGTGEMLQVGTLALGAVCLLAVYFIATGSKHTPSLMSFLYRAVPLFIIGLYMFMNLPPTGR